MRPLMAHCDFSFGKLCRERKSAGAHDLLTSAASAYRDMGMTFWLNQAETMRGELVL